jgi:hypothetical protein
MKADRLQPPPAANATAAARARERPSLSLHIERLVLDQLPLRRSEQGQVQAAAMTELELLLGRGVLQSELRQGISMPVLRLGDIRLRHGASPEQIGRQIAHALYRGFCR